jgi:macrolide transport system ATP-binding/permease protein
MGTFWQDVKFGIRLLGKSPGFSLIAVLTLALGIGANTTIFSWVNSVLINTIPGARNPGELVMVVPGSPTFPVASFSYPDYLDYREKNTVLAGLALHDSVSLNLAGDASPERIWGQLVTANFFDILGVQTIVGRAFLPDEDIGFGGHPVMVISYALWQRRFGGDPEIIGKTVRLNNSPYMVIGVAPRGFQGGENGLAFDIWVPMTMCPQLDGRRESDFKSRGNHSFTSVGRLKPGIGIEQAQAGLNVIAGQLAKQYPDTNDKWTVRVYPLWRAPHGAAEVLSTVLLILLGTVAIVLLIACANVANLLLVRASRRRREIAIRLSIGASRGRLLRQLLTESIMLSLLGGTVGILVSLWTSRMLMMLAPPSDLPISVNSQVDGTVIAVAFGLSLLTGVIFGLAPALQSSQINVVTSLKEESGSAGWSWRRAWMRNALVVCQVTLSLVLLIAASLCIRSLDYARSMKLGFQPKNVLLARMDLFSSGYNSDKGRIFLRQVVDKVQSLPGVRSATLGRRVPLGFGGNSSSTIRVEGYEPAKDETVWSNHTSVGPEYCKVMEMPLVRGRDFTREDTVDKPRVAIINQTLAGRYWREADPIGKRFFYGGGPVIVIGIARDSKYRSLNEPPAPYFFVPLQQFYSDNVTLILRTHGDPALLSTAAIKAVQELDSSLLLFGVRTLEENIRAATFQQQMASTMLGAFGLLALFLAAIGVYGVISYAVAQQTREFGIRIAIGAQPQNLLWWVMRHGMGLAALGLAIGLPAAWGAARLLRSLLLGVSSSDPMSYAGVTLALSAVAFIACLVPACRAARVDPIISLRYE